MNVFNIRISGNIDRFKGVLSGTERTVTVNGMIQTWIDIYDHRAGVGPVLMDSRLIDERPEEVA